MDDVFQLGKCQIGGFTEFDFEPDFKQTANAVEIVLNKILDGVKDIRIIDVNVIAKTPDDYKELPASDPLRECTDLPKKWTIGVKITAERGMFKDGYGRHILHEGVSPEPMEI